jgi:hypothetical protein
MLSLALLSQLTLAAAPPALPVDEIVRRTAELVARPVPGLRCKVVMSVQQADGDGKVEHDLRGEFEEARGADGKAERKVVKATADGKDVTAEWHAKEQEEKRKRDAQAAEARARQEKAGQAPAARPEQGQPGGKPGMSASLEDLSPFSPKRVAAHRFTLLRTETLWQRPAYVLAVSAIKANATSANGTVWVDAEHFVPLRGEYQPARLPRLVSWIKILAQEERLGGGGVAPTLLKIDGSGGLPLFRKRFASTFRWSGCRQAPVPTP